MSIWVISHQEGSSQLKEVVGRLSKLRYEIMTNKPLCRVEDQMSDAAVWNSFIDELYKCEGTVCKQGACYVSVLITLC